MNTVRIDIRRRRLIAHVGAAVLGIALLIWTLIPVYNMFLIALSDDGDEFTGAIWPEDWNWDSFRVVLMQDYWYLEHFWVQFGNSVIIGVASMALTALIASLTAFALGRMRLRHGWIVSDTALLTCVLPNAFLVIPFVHLMHVYGLSDSIWSVVAAQVTFATPFAILILHQFGKLIPMEVDEAAKVDGATPLQVYRHVYVPLLAPALIAVGLYAFLLAWNDYLYQFLLLSSPANSTVAVAINQFFNSDEAPWNYMMAVALIYALPPIAVYFVLRRFVISGLTLARLVQ
jgi:multiple sugar transport system permease protein